MRNRRRHPRAFTLLELVLVLVLLATAMAVVAPSFSGFRRGGELRDAADQFVALTRYARSQAAASGATHRIEIDEQKNTYRVLVQNGESYESVGTSWGRAFPLPEGATIRVNGSGSVKTVDFHPTGRLDPVTVTIANARGDSIAIIAPTPAEGFIVSKNPSEVTR